MVERVHREEVKVNSQEVRPLLKEREDGAMSLTETAEEFLEYSEGTLKTVTVIGPQSSGKSTLLNALIGERDHSMWTQTKRKKIQLS